ncbi:MAG TPA: hypothetical protein VMU28_07680 [Terriglobales bacterium]|nr:hypothetical protein [Terriglobales bacterium]
MDADYFSMIQHDGAVYRFVLRDRTGVRPSIHGYGHTMAEAQSKLEEILNALEQHEQHEPQVA